MWTDIKNSSNLTSAIILIYFLFKWCSALRSFSVDNRNIKNFNFKLFRMPNSGQIAVSDDWVVYARHVVSLNNFALEGLRISALDLKTGQDKLLDQSNGQVRDSVWFWPFLFGRKFNFADSKLDTRLYLAKGISTRLGGPYSK